MPNPSSTAATPAALPILHTILLANPVNTPALVGAFLLQEYGDRKFRNSRLANLALATAEQQQQPAGELARAGFLLVQSATQVVELLDIRRLPEIQRLLDWVAVATPAEGGRDANFHLAELVDQYVATHQAGQELTPLVSVVFPLLAAHLQRERRTYYDLPQAWADARNAQRVQELDMQHAGSTVFVIRVQSDAPDLAPFLHDYRKTQADLVIQEVQPGSLLVSVAPKKKVSLDDVARIVRIEEKRRRGQAVADLPPTEREALATEGRWNTITAWWYDKVGGRLLGGPASGGLATPPDAEPSLLSLDDLVNAVFVGLSNSVWEKEDTDACRGPGCYFYDYYLPRCQRRLQQQASPGQPSAAQHPTFSQQPTA